MTRMRFFLRRGSAFSGVGGTYARALQGRGVAYGGNFGGGGGHNADEFYPIQDLAKQGKICLFTLYKLACED